MSKLLIWICLLGAVGLVAVGGCTPEAENAWSETLDFGDIDPRLADMTSTYYIGTAVDEAFTVLTIYQSGNRLQGFDNKQRSWSGTVGGSSPTGTAGYVWPQMQLQTADGPEGQVVMAVTGCIWVIAPDVCATGFDGMIYTENDSGYITGEGPGCPCELDE